MSDIEPICRKCGKSIPGGSWAGVKMARRGFEYEHLQCPSPCPTCEATQREMAELRAKIAALAKEMDVYDRNPTLRYFEQKLRALLAQPGAQQEEGEEA